MGKSTVSIKPKMISRDIVRHWPIWTMSLVVYLFIVFLINSFAKGFKSTISEYEFSMTIVQTLIEVTKWVSFIMGLAAAWAAFGFLGKKRKNYFYEALPFNRLSLFANRFLFGFLVCILPCVVMFFIELLQILAVTGRFEIVMLLKWFASAFIEYFFWYAFAVLFMVLCGRTIMAGFCYLFFSLLGLLMNVFMHIINLVCFIGVQDGMGDGSSVFGILSPVEYLSQIDTNYINFKKITDENAILSDNNLFTDGSVEKMILVLITGLLITIIACFIYIIRKEENTGDNVVFKGVKIAFCAALSFASTVILTMAVYMIIFYRHDAIAHRVGDRITLIILLFVIGFWEYLICSMVVEKRLKVFKKYSLKALIFVVVISLIGTGYLHDLFNIEGYIPKKEDIEYVNLENYNEMYNSSSFEFAFDSPRKLHKLTEKDDIKSIIELHRFIIKNIEDTGDLQYMDNASNYYSFYFSYKLNNGSTVSRRYQILSGSEIDGMIKKIIERGDWS